MKKLIGLLLVVMLLLTAIPAMAEEPLTLTYAHIQNKANRDTEAEVDAMYTMMEEFQAAHPEIAVEETSMNQADYIVKIQAQATANDLPDVFWMKGSWTTMFVENEAVMPLNDFIETLPFKDSYRSGIFKAAQRDGNIYGLPVQYTVTSIVYYNADLWKQAGYDSFPTTWDEIFEANEKFKEMGIITIALGNKDNWPYESCVLSALGDRFTGTDWTNSIIDQDGVAKFTDQPFVDSLALTQKLAEEGVFNTDFNTIDNEQAQAYFAEGKAATSLEGIWALNRYVTMSAPEVKENIKVAVLPAVEGGAGNPNTTSGGCGWYISVNSHLEGERLEAALEFISTVYGEGWSKYMAERYGQNGPIAVEGADLSAFDPLIQECVGMLNSISYTPIYDIQMEGAVIEVLNTGIQELMNGDLTPEQLAENVQFEQDGL